MVTRQQKITFGEMRASGVQSVVIYCADYLPEMKIMKHFSLAGFPAVRDPEAQQLLLGLVPEIQLMSKFLGNHRVTLLLACRNGLFPEDAMNKTILSLALGASALFATAASAAPLAYGLAVIPDSGIENVRMVCNENGRCWRERGQRRVIVEDSYNYAPRERYIERRGYYDGGYYNNGPSVGIGVGPGGVGIGFGAGPRW